MELEQEVLENARRILARAAPTLIARGISHADPEIKSDNKFSRSSELKIDFFRHDQIIDVLEFGIHRDGVPLVGLGEAVDWLEEQIQTVGVGNESD